MRPYMIKVFLGAAALLAAVSIAQDAHAGVILLADNFDAETHGLNHTTFANWTVTAGSVDVLGPHFFDLFPGHGEYVDLDGSTRNQNPAGQLSSKLDFAAGKYAVSFLLGGNQRTTASKTTIVSLGSFSQAITLGEFAPLTL